MEARKERLDVTPCLRAAVEASPASADDAGQLVADVDRDEEALEAVAAAQSVDEDRLDVGLHLLQDRIGLDEVLPGLEREQRFGRARRARIEAHDPAERRVAKQECH